MNYEKALSLYRKDKTLQLLRAEHFPLLMGFFHLAFKQQNTISPPWRIPEILAAMLCSEHMYFDAVSQIHIPSWSEGRIALLGDAAYTTGFPAGMGTSLAMEGAAILAKTLQSSEGNYTTAFSTYYDTFHPFIKEVQARITRGLN